MLLGVGYGLPAGIVALAILMAICLGSLNFYHFEKNKHIPSLLKYLSAAIIFSLFVALTIAGFALDFLSNFAVFTIFMLILIVSLFLVYLFLFYSKIQMEYTHPHVYSPYGLDIYVFQS